MPGETARMESRADHDRMNSTGWRHPTGWRSPPRQASPENLRKNPGTPAQNPSKSPGAPRPRTLVMALKSDAVRWIRGRSSCPSRPRRSAGPRGPPPRGPARSRRAGPRLRAIVSRRRRARRQFLLLPVGGCGGEEGELLGPCAGCGGGKQGSLPCVAVVLGSGRKGGRPPPQGTLRARAGGGGGGAGRSCLHQAPCSHQNSKTTIWNHEATDCYYC